MEHLCGLRHQEIILCSVDITCRIIAQELSCTRGGVDLTSELKRDLEVLDRYSDAQIEVHEDIASWLCNGIGSCL